MLLLRAIDELGKSALIRQLLDGLADKQDAGALIFLRRQRYVLYFGINRTKLGTRPMSVLMHGLSAYFRSDLTASSVVKTPLAIMP